MKSLPLLLCTAVAFGVVAAGCGGSSSNSAAAFCSSLHAMAADMRGLGTSLAASKATLRTAAADLPKLESSAPASLKGDLLTESNALDRWESTGDVSVLNSSAFLTANQKLSDWAQANCKAS
jgi:hypothetical protein